MNNPTISKRITVKGKEDETITGNFEVTISGEGRSTLLIHSKTTTGRHGHDACILPYSAAERNRIVAAIETYLEDMDSK